MKKITIFFFIICMLLPREASAGKIKLTVWAMGEEGIRISRLAEKFERLYPGVEVVTMSIPWGNAMQKLITGVVGEITPDVCQLGTTWMKDFVSLNALEPLDTYLTTKPEFSPGDFFKGAWETTQFNNKTYGIPWYVETRVLFYRKDILKSVGWDHPPRTWDELFECGKALYLDEDRDGRPERYGINLPAQDIGGQLYSAFIWQNGGEILPPPFNRAALDQPAVIDALTFYANLFRNKLAPLRGTLGIKESEAFKSGLFPMLVTGPWMVENLNKYVPEIKGKWFISPLPYKKQPASFIGGSNLVMFKLSRHKKWAWKFIQFLSSVETQLEWYKIATALPSRKDAWNSPPLLNDPYLRIFGEQMKSARSTPVIKGWEEFANKFAYLMEKMMFKTAEISDDNEFREAVHNEISGFSKELNPILQKKRISQSTGYKIFLTSLIIAMMTGLIVYWFIKRDGDGEAHKVINKGFRVSLRIPVLFIMPSLILLTVFLFLPIVFTFIASMTNWDLSGVTDMNLIVFNGISNYRRLFQDDLFWRSMLNTFVFAFIGVPLTIIVAMVIAVLVNDRLIRFKGLFRVGYFVPVVTTLVAAAVIWRWLYAYKDGVLNYFLESLKLPRYDWLNSTKLALPSLIVMATWKNFGYNMIIFLAGLQGIPAQLYEASEIDGANKLDQFRHITMPMLVPTTFFVTIMSTIGYLQFFAEPFVMTNGGPKNATYSMVLYMYNQGFKFYNMGYASAVAYVIFVIIILFSVMQVRISKKLFS